MNGSLRTVGSSLFGDSVPLHRFHLYLGPLFTSILRHANLGFFVSVYLNKIKALLRLLCWESPTTVYRTIVKFMLPAVLTRNQ